jgi:hypothetical protein
MYFNLTVVLDSGFNSWTDLMEHRANFIKTGGTVVCQLTMEVIAQYFHL